MIDNLVTSSEVLLSSITCQQELINIISYLHSWCRVQFVSYMATQWVFSECHSDSMHVCYWYGANAAKGVHFLRDPITPQQQYWYLAGTNTVVPLGSAVRESGSMNSSKATCSLFLMHFWKTKVEKSFRKWFSKQGTVCAYQFFKSLVLTPINIHVKTLELVLFYFLNWRPVYTSKSTAHWFAFRGVNEVRNRIRCVYT